MTKPTEKQIETEIEWLKRNKPKITQYSTFGDDNHAAVDAVMRVLEKRLDEDAVFDLGLNSYSEGSALDAARWLSGDEEESPSDEWKGLAK